MNYNKADFIASYGISSQLPESDRPELSFSGRSNVGKSSLINKLCNRKNLARVSSTPGKTATINFYEVGDCYFVDLPGYGYAKVSNADRERWDDLINSYFELSATTPCWSSSSTAVTPPAPMTSRCCIISTTTTSPSSWP